MRATPRDGKAAFPSRDILQTRPAPQSATEKKYTRKKWDFQPGRRIEIRARTWIARLGVVGSCVHVNALPAGRSPSSGDPHLRQPP